ncbi:MAG TPA: MFS transporter, partial [Polyangia bacterium]|nr:MFS transporter [Polyangia bacterium]
MISNPSLAAALPTRVGRLSPTVTFYLLASIVLFFLAGSSAPTPLYMVYQAAWGFSPVTVTVIFGIYALAVLATLLTMGSLSDYIGRRPVLIAATAVQAVTMLIFATANSVTALLVARVIQGLSTGAAIGAVGAGMLDLDRAKGTIANAVGPMAGTATGGLLSGLMVQYLPAPTHLVYLVLCAIFVLQSLGAMLMPESVTPRPGALASLRPHFRLPVAVRGAVLLAIPALVATWALAGFYGSLGPALVRRILGSSSVVVGGLTLFVLAGSGAITVLLLRHRTARAMMTFGATALIVGVGLTLLATARGSALLFFTGAALAGAGFGAGFQGAIRTVLPLTAAHERAGVLSVLYVVSYLGMGLPAVLGGLRVVHGGGLLTTAREYGAAVMLLAAVALVGTRAQPRDARQT